MRFQQAMHPPLVGALLLLLVPLLPPLASAQNSIGRQDGQGGSDQTGEADARDAWAADTGANATDTVYARVAILITNELPLLEDKFGYATSAGAVSVALDRIQREGLLSHVQWRFHVAFTQCDEATAAGEVIRLIEEENVNSLIGPPCSTTAQATGVIAKYYNVPVFSWASTSLALADHQRFSTLTRVISSSIRLGRALREMMTYFNWRRFALLFTDDKATRNCYSIAEGVRKAISKVNILNVYNMAIDKSTISDEQIEKFLTGMPDFARVAIVCLEHEEDIRRFMLKAFDLGMTGSDYVYILPTYVRDANRSEMWLQYAGAQQAADNRDLDARAAFRPVLMLEAKLSSDDEVHYFKKQIIQRIKDYPFYYDSKSATDQQYGSLYSPFLHDAVYLYGLALNRTITAGGSIDTGTWIMNTTRGAQFLGVSGHVVIDETGGREPNFVIKGFDNKMKMTAFAEALMYKEDGDTIHLLVPERILWETRAGVVPVDTPKCGYNGELCAARGNEKLMLYLVAGAVTGLLLCAIILILLISYIRKSLVSSEMSKMLWKINYSDMDFINDKKRSKSCASANTISTTMSDDTQEAIAKGYVNIAHFRGLLVWTKEHGGSMIFSSNEDHEHMKSMRDMAHDNMNMFMGLCLDAPRPFSVWKYLSKGSLEDVLHNENYKLDWFFKFSLIKDLGAGMEYLHNGMGSHGRLRSSNCLVDQAWQLKITDYGLYKMRVNKKEAKDKLWTAPEFLRMLDPPLTGSLEGDVYSYAIIVQEVLTRDRPFCNDNISPGDAVLRVAKAESPPFRPTVNISNSNEADPAMIQLMNDCWKEEPSFRPTFHAIKSQVRAMGRGRKINLMDHAVKMMEKYTAGLEQTMVERQKQMQDEVSKADTMIYQLLPKSIADKMKAGQMVEPELYESSTLLCVEMANFEEMITGSSALQCIGMLNDVQHYVNETTAKTDCYRVESMGSGVIGVSGVPVRNGKQHAVIVADLALQMVNDCADGNVVSNPTAANKKSQNLQLRVGIHSGQVYAGVAGTAIPRFCAWGPSVDIAMRMEETGKTNCVHMSEATQQLLMELGGGYVTKPRGEIVVKGHGVMFTYWLLGRSNNTIYDATSDVTSRNSAGSKDPRTSHSDVRSITSASEADAKSQSHIGSVYSTGSQQQTEPGDA